MAYEKVDYTCPGCGEDFQAGAWVDVQCPGCGQWWETDSESSVGGEGESWTFWIVGPVVKLEEPPSPELQDDW